MNSPLTKLLLSHRQSRQPIRDLPTELIPATVADAYHIQDETIAALDAIGAWKVTPKPEDGEPFCSPIPASAVHRSGALLDLWPQQEHVIEVEVEVAVVIRDNLPSRKGGYAARDMVEAIGGLHIAIEILNSRYVSRRNAPPLAAIADLHSSGAIILGEMVNPGQLPELASLPMSLTFDGVPVGQTQGNASTENMLEALAWLGNHAAARGLPLKAGDVVITGARLGPIGFNGRTVEAQSPDLGTVRLNLV